MNATRDASQDAPRDLPHTTPHHTTKNTSSLGMALGDPERVPRSRLATVIAAIRPDWRLDDIVHAIAADDRPLRTVVMAHVTAAYDPTTAHPNRARTIPFGATPTAQPLPTVADALNPQLDDHGFEVGRCPICRRGGRP